MPPKKGPKPDGSQNNPLDNDMTDAGTTDQSPTQSAVFFRDSASGELRPQRPPNDTLIFSRPRNEALRPRNEASKTSKWGIICKYLAEMKNSNSDFYCHVVSVILFLNPPNQCLLITV